MLEVNVENEIPKYRLSESNYYTLKGLGKAGDSYNDVVSAIPEMSKNSDTPSLSQYLRQPKSQWLVSQLLA